MTYHRRFLRNSQILQNSLLYTAQCETFIYTFLGLRLKYNHHILTYPLVKVLKISNILNFQNQIPKTCCMPTNIKSFEF